MTQEVFEATKGLYLGRFVAKKEWPVTHRHKVLPGNFVFIKKVDAIIPYMVMETDPIGEYISLFNVPEPEFEFVSENSYIEMTSDVQIKEEDHTGMIQGYDGEWRWV